jgi:mannose-6-phosphate isomerase-like protein (cupin superfamily)
VSENALLALTVADQIAATVTSGKRYAEFLRVASMSAGMYLLPAGGEDTQRPHNEDELYVVVEGRSTFVCNGELIDVQPGTLLYVAAQAEHRFFDIEEDLAIVVLFAPAETER